MMQQFFVAVLMTGVAVAQTGWSLMTPTGPLPRSDYGMAHDTGRGVSVVFGGSYNLPYGFPVGFVLQNDTLEWNGTSWTIRFPVNRPSPRRNPAMAFDIVRNRVVMFGGQTSGGHSDETWEYDGTNWALRPTAVRPTVRADAGMAYDSARNVMVLFGGSVGSGLSTTTLGDTWEWNGSTWIQRMPATVPPARWSCCLVGDLTRGNVVMFGGSNGVSMDDTWVWNGTDWQQRFPATSPPRRMSAAAAYDADRMLVMIFGGLTAVSPTGGLPNNDMWLWDGSSWRADTTSPRPSPRFGMRLVYDVARRRSVMFSGGAGGTAYLGDTWEYVPIALAQWNPGGAGCAGPSGTPMLLPQVGSLPQLGSTFTLRLSYGNGTGVGLLAAGLSNVTWSGGSLPVDLGLIGMPGCQGFTSAEWTSAIVLTNGIGLLHWSLPAAPTLAGYRFHAQGLVLDPAANPFGAVTSGSGEVLLGV